MSSKLVIGPFTKGLRNDVTPFNIDNENFPVLVNAYQWRGRVKRKRGTSLLGRLNRTLGTTDGSGNLVITINNFTPSTIIQTGIVQFSVGSDVFIDKGGSNPVALTTNGVGTGTLNRTTTVLTITGSQPNTAVIYYPDLPVMGLEDLVLDANYFPATLGFDTIYAYNINTGFPFPIYDVSFYKNPSTATYAGYIDKGTWTPLTWNGQDYQQFWTTNYQNALWVTNGVTDPFVTTNIGMQFKPIITITVLTATTANLNITAHGLVIGDFIFVNEVLSTTGINFQTGYVTTVTDANNVIVTFPNATLATNGTLGIAQYLTNRSDPTKDCIRFYDGDPTSAGVLPPSTTKGWVNFCPPLISGPNNIFSIADLPPAQYYLVGAKIIFPFKDRLIFIGPVVQTSASGSSSFYLQDTVIYSQNGTPYYTTSFPYSTVTPSASVLAMTTFSPILVPTNQTATPNAFFEDTTGYGGFITAGYAQPLTTMAPNEDVLILGFANNRQARFVYTGNDIVPFNFFVINSELGDASTFSAVTFDRGKMSVGSRGIIITSQISSERSDLEIPDQVFQIRLRDHGTQRVTAQRDFINEWIYFTYPVNSQLYIFPNQTLQYNYRDKSWGVFNESYTTYGQFRQSSGYTWATIGMKFPTWSAWNEPWNAGSTTILQPQVIAGNQQGYIVFRDDGTDEANSLYIQNFVGTTVTSPNHCLNDGDFIVVSGVLGSIGNFVNDVIFQVSNATTNTFMAVSNVVPTGTYLGGGQIKRMYRPTILTKQFPMTWSLARKTRIGVQQYLFTKTVDGQITLQIYLSENQNAPYNFGPIIPAVNSQNNALVYTDILFTCSETNNLNSLTGEQQQQIWHRMNTSLLGDTIQVGFTLSDDQMRDPTFRYQFKEIELHGCIIDTYPSQLLT